ncbi:IS66 family transposase [Bradyrhizobium sp. Arg314]
MIAAPTRGFVGPNLLAMLLFEKFGQHQPLNRQSERYGREGIDLSVSTLADRVGAATVALKPLRKPLRELIARHVMAAERLHADDTTVPILAKSKTDTGWIWTLRWRRSAGGALLRLARPAARASGRASRGLARHPAGRHLWRIQWALGTRASGRAGHVGALLVPCPSRLL